MMRGGMDCLIGCEPASGFGTDGVDDSAYCRPIEAPMIAAVPTTVATLTPATTVAEAISAAPIAVKRYVPMTSATLFYPSAFLTQLQRPRPQ